MKTTVPGRVSHIEAGKAHVNVKFGMHHAANIEMPGAGLLVGSVVSVQVIDLDFPDPGTPPKVIAAFPLGTALVCNEQCIMELKPTPVIKRCPNCRWTTVAYREDPIHCCSCDGADRGVFWTEEVGSAEGVGLIWDEKPCGSANTATHAKTRTSFLSLGLSSVALLSAPNANPR